LNNISCVLFPHLIYKTTKILLTIYNTSSHYISIYSKKINSQITRTFTMTTKIFQKFFSLFLLLAVISAIANAQELSLDYYKYSCPGVEDIAKKITEQYISNVPGFAPGLLRMVFHDCFVRVCMFIIIPSTIILFSSFTHIIFYSIFTSDIT
jgi:hypothetical protein